MRNSDPSRTVAGRMLAVLEVFETNGSMLSLSEIAELADLPVSTAHRVVGELSGWGALTRDSQGRYQIGLRLWELGQNAGRRLRETARPFLQDLFSLTGQTAHLAVREGDEALYVDRIYSSKRVPRASRIGGRLPLHATAVGKVMLAYEEPWFRNAYLSGALAPMTAFTHVDVGTLREELSEIAQQGYAIAGEEARVGACSIAVPVAIMQDTAQPVGAGAGFGASIGIVALASHLPTLTQHLPVLQGVARRIEGAILQRLPVTRFR